MAHYDFIYMVDSYGITFLQSLINNDTVYNYQKSRFSVENRKMSASWREQIRANLELRLPCTLGTHVHDIFFTSDGSSWRCSLHLDPCLINHISWTLFAYATTTLENRKFVGLDWISASWTDWDLEISGALCTSIHEL